MKYLLDFDSPYLKSKTLYKTEKQDYFFVKVKS